MTDEELTKELDKLGAKYKLNPVVQSVWYIMTGLFMIIMAVLKAMGLIQISWWVVFIPIWVPIAIALVTAALLFIVFAIYRK